MSRRPMPSHQAATKVSKYNGPYIAFNDDKIPLIEQKGRCDMIVYETAVKTMKKLIQVTPTPSIMNIWSQNSAKLNTEMFIDGTTGEK